MMIELRRKMKRFPLTVWGYRKAKLLQLRLECMHLADAPVLIDLRKYGSKNPDKNIYFVSFKDDNCGGFFAIFNVVLKHFAYARRFNLCPVVQYGKTLYTEDVPINNTTNTFEYYFEQPCNISTEEVFQSASVMKARWLKDGALICPEIYKITPENLDELAHACKAYIRLNKNIEKEIGEDILKILQTKKTLGVQFRGTDFKKGFSGHPMALEIEELAQRVEKALDQFDFEQIFLATDDLEAVSCFQQKFPQKLVFYTEALRADGDESVAFIAERTKREHSRYKAGYEVLRDALTLSACEGFIAGISNVSIAARIFKKSQGKEYAYLDVYSKGINC